MPSVLRSRLAAGWAEGRKWRKRVGLGAEEMKSACMGLGLLEVMRCRLMVMDQMVMTMASVEDAKDIGCLQEIPGTCGDRRMNVEHCSEPLVHHRCRSLPLRLIVVEEPGTKQVKQRRRAHPDRHQHVQHALPHV